MKVLKVISVTFLIFMIGYGELCSQTIPKLPPPLTLEVSDDDGYESLEVSALNFVIRLTGLVYYYQQYAFDEQMALELERIENDLEELLMAGDLVVNIARLTTIQNRFRITVLNAISYENELIAEEEKSDDLFSRINEIKRTGNRVNISSSNQSPVIKNGFEQIEYAEDRIEVKTGRSETFSSILFDTDYLRTADFYLEALIQVKEYEPLIWDPSPGIIFGSGSDDNYHVFKMNFIDKSVDFLTYNFGNLAKPDYRFAIEKFNSPRTGNELAVYKEGNTFYFFLNQELILEADDLALYGHNMGLYVDSGLNLSVSNFYLYQK
jgi:hypothetical protein